MSAVSIPQLASPLIWRLSHLLAEVASEPVRLSHRWIADRLGCSPGAIPKLMARLEDQGLIQRTRVANSYVVAWCETITNDHTCDRSQTITDVIDHTCDHGDIAEQDAPNEETITPNAYSMSMSMNSMSMARTREKQPGSLPRRPKEIYSERTWAQILAYEPAYDSAQFEADIATALKRPDIHSRKSAIGLVLHCRANGLTLFETRQPAQPAQENAHVHQTRRQPDRPRRETSERVERLTPEQLAERAQPQSELPKLSGNWTFA